MSERAARLILCVCVCVCAQPVCVCAVCVCVMDERGIRERKQRSERSIDN